MRMDLYALKNYKHLPLVEITHMLILSEIISMSELSFELISTMITKRNVFGCVISDW